MFQVGTIQSMPKYITTKQTTQTTIAWTAIRQDLAAWMSDRLTSTTRAISRIRRQVVCQVKAVKAAINAAEVAAEQAYKSTREAAWQA
jgi:hypothetical protein